LIRWPRSFAPRARDGHADAAAIAEQSMRRFAAAVLGITV
jgi:hypothetical protein